MTYAASKNFTAPDQQKFRLVVLDFEARWLNSTLATYGEDGPGYICGEEYDYPVEFHDYPGKFRIEKLRREIASLGGQFFLKPDLDEQKDGNPINWDQAAVAVPVASATENTDEIANRVVSISLALQQSGLFTRGSVSDVREAKLGVQNVVRANTKALWRPKWRGSWRGGALVQPNV